MNTEVSVCGSNCSTCEYFKNKECAGCKHIKGKVWWVGYVHATTCPIYDCVINTRNIDNCGLCREMPCTLWYDLKDPGLTDEQHKQSISERVERLKKQ